MSTIQKMSRYLLILLGLTVFSIRSMSQFVPVNSEEDDTPKEKNGNKFFLSVVTSTYTDMIISPLKYHFTATGNTDAQGNPTFASLPFQSIQYNIVSIGMEPRYNLQEFDENTALSLSAPVSFGIGVTGPVDDSKVRGTSGFGSLQIPVLLKIYTGNGSTYNTMKNFGFNAGGGLEFNKIGLINLSGETSPFNQPFVLPCLSAGITFMRGDSPMEINFKYGFGRLKTQDINGQGDPLLDNTGVPYQRTTRGQTLKLSFIYLMNY